ncbi:MAG: hypothetical protein WC788_07750 [Candidatus Paceibacterota bacterium]|jgi:hypothetical protein
MSNHLYTSNGASGHIKPDLVNDTLRHAKLRGNLSGVDSSTRRRFVEEFEETKHKVQGIGSQYSAHDVEKIINRMKLNKKDKITDDQIEKIREVMIDQDTNT